MKTETFPLTYFTHKTLSELDEIIDALKDSLPKEEIANLLIEKFDANKLGEISGVSVSDKFELAIKHTLNYAIDTELLIRYIYDKVDEE